MVWGKLGDTIYNYIAVDNVYFSYVVKVDFQKNDDGRFAGRTVGEELLAGRGMFTEQHWYWICVIALFGFSLFFNLCFVAALTYLKRKTRSFCFIISCETV